MTSLFLLLLVAIALWVTASYRRLIGLRTQLLARWSLIDLHLRTRHDLVLGLVNAVRSAMAFEREALTGIMETRERAIGAAGPVEAARREEDLSLAIERLFAAAAGYPTLEAHREIVAIREELSAVGKKIRAAQQSYNDTAGQYNAAQRIFPLSLLAPQLGLHQAEGFETSSLAVLAVAIALSAVSAALHAQAPLAVRGFSPAAAAAETALERTLKQALSAQDASADFDVLTAEPHHLGSPYEIYLADFVAGRFKDFGLDVSRDEYSALVPWPTNRHIDIVAPDSMAVPVDEELLPQDRYAAKPGILPAYNAYSPSGDVTGGVVYVNYGVPADYETLDKAGVSVAGKIVLARYGGSWRGIKPKVAAEHGAIGCLIYSDPKDDGYFQGDAYPDGPFRSLGMIQRGSVLDLPRRPGDPSTPSGPSVPGVPRVPLNQIETLARIPVQPMSGHAAMELLKRMGGDVAPETWRGALPLTYHLGGGPLRVRLKLQMDYSERRLIDVVGRIPGSQFPDEWIILGSHRDAWVFGAADPESGQTAVLNVARTLGTMLKQGWRPARTILIASWDGEEPGLIGSTEWVEQFSSDLNRKAAVYINLDPGATGPFISTGAVRSLAPFLREVAESVESDVPGKSLYARWLNHVQGDSSEPPPPLVGALGSGSDYTPFLDHAGVASLDIGLRGPADFGTYHSLYDDPAWFKTFIDPDFKTSVRASQATGVALLRLADADVLPFDYAVYGQQILEYVDELEREAKGRWPAAMPALDFGALKTSVRGLMKAGADASAEGDRLTKGPRDAAAISRLNHRLIMAERDLTDPAGLPDRPWYRHLIYAPGLYTGYAVKTIPGVREAIEGMNATRAVEQSRALLRAIQRATRTLGS